LAEGADVALTIRGRDEYSGVVAGANAGITSLNTGVSQSSRALGSLGTLARSSGTLLRLAGADAAAEFLLVGQQVAVATRAVLTLGRAAQALRVSRTAASVVGPASAGGAAAASASAPTAAAGASLQAGAVAAGATTRAAAGASAAQLQTGASAAGGSMRAGGAAAAAELRAGAAAAAATQRVSAAGSAVSGAGALAGRGAAAGGGALAGAGAFALPALALLAGGFLGVQLAKGLKEGPQGGPSVTNHITVTGAGGGPIEQQRLAEQIAREVERGMASRSRFADSG